jgi:hypothetical protein
LFDDDIIFARELKTDGTLGDPEDDTIQAWVWDGCVIVIVEFVKAMMSHLCRQIIEDQTVIDNLRKIQEEIIGNKNLAGPDRPVKQCDGSFTGGLGFERNDWIVGVKGTCCYTIGPSTQVWKTLVSPTASGKVMDEKMNADQQLRFRMLKVRSHINSKR